MTHPRFFAAAALVAVGLSPASALAATPQQSLNQAMKSSMNRVPVWMAGDVTVSVSERPLAKNGTTTYGTVKIGMTERVLSLDKANAQNEGRVVLNQFDFHSSSAGNEMPLKLDPGLTVQWKTVGQKAYFRLEQLPEQASSFLKMIGIDASVLVGQWIEAGRTGAVESAMTALPSTAALGLPATDVASADQLNLLKNMSIFFVRRVEKRETTADGHALLRLRVALNPRVVTTLYNAELRAIPRTDPLRTEKVRTLNKEFAKLRTFLAGAQFVAFVDETTQTLTRFEMGGRYTSPKQSCTTNWTTNRESCRTVAMTTITYLGGMSIARDTGPAITAPDGSLTIEQLTDRLKAAVSTSTSAEATSTLP